MKFTENHFQNLPVHPVLKQDEWRETYFVRVARANGLHSPQKEDIDRLRHGYKGNKTPSRQECNTYSDDLPMWAVKKVGAQIRYCPECLERDRYIRTRWRLKAFEMCTEHHLLLKSGLVEPALSVEANYPNAKRLTDITSQQIWEGAICPMPKEKIHALAVWEEFELRLNSMDSESARESLAWALTAERLLDTICTSKLNPEMPLKNESKLCHRAHWLDKNNLKISATKEGILDFLLSLKVHRDRRAAATCLKFMINQCERCTTIFSTIPLPEIYHRLLAVKPETYCPISNGALPARLRPEGYISINHAEAVLGRKTNFLYFLVRANFFEKVARVKFGRRTYIFLHASEVEGCRRWLSGCMTPAQAMHFLNISSSMFLALQRSGVVQPIILGAWALFRRDDISLLMNKLDSVARPYPENITQLHAFFSTYAGCQTKKYQVFPRLLQEVLKGSVSLYRKLDESGLQAYFVDRTTAILSRQLTADFQASKRSKSIGADQQLLFENPH